VTPDAAGAARGADLAATVLRTLAAALALPPLLAGLAAGAIVLGLWGASPRRLHALYVRFARVAVRVGGTPVAVRGRERLEPGTAYVVVSNHESAWDPICLLAALPELTLRFVVKRAVMRIPLLGAALRVTGNLTVLRTDTRGDVRRVEQGMERRDPEISMIFFAEGTRSRDGALHPFKKGAFAAAVHHRLPVLPVGVAGTRRIWPKGRFALRPGPVAIAVGRPISVEGLGEADRERLRERCYAAVFDLRRQARTELRRRGVEPGGVDGDGHAPGRDGDAS
jgi:1-acyl-sn-glycerol-3-phosphate acyltransferase